jgi:L,D-transpeptidase ErfK/SrfK
MRGNALAGALLILALPFCAVGAGDDPAEQAVRVLGPDSDLVGELLTVHARYEDTLIDIARAHGLGYHAIRNANPGVDPWVPGEGTPVALPRRHVLPRTRRSGIVINLPEMRLYDFTPGDGQLMTYAVSIGRMDWSTPVGTLSVIEKTEQPAWHPPASVRESYAARGQSLPARVPPGPDNPLGDFAMRLSRPSYLIHGTNWPEGIGMRATHGCIRLGPADIEHLFSRIPVGTHVHIVNEPVKAGWSGDTLYLEAHPVLEELQEPNNLTPAVRAVVAATGARMARVDWNAVHRWPRHAPASRSRWGCSSRLRIYPKPPAPVTRSPRTGHRRAKARRRSGTCRWAVSAWPRTRKGSRHA